MNKAQFDYMCNTYGDSSLAENEKWKSVAYIATTTTKVPTFSAQYYLRTDQLQYSEKFGEPGFFLIDYLYSPFGPFSNRQGLTVTFIPLSKVTAIAVTSKVTYKDDGGSTVKPQEPDAIVGTIGADGITDRIITISTSEDNADNGADPDAEYNIIYNGLGANTAEDSDLDIEKSEEVIDTTNAKDESVNYIFTLDENGANPDIDADSIYDANEVI